MHQQLGVAPCALLGMLNDRGIAASCEMDVANIIPMRALESASGAPAALLDWNNNYGDDPDKCILFHCGPVARALMTAPGIIAVHKMFAKNTDPDEGWGVNEGRIKPMPITYASAATMDGKIWTYAGTGEITSDPVEKEFFGCAGVAKIEGLQKKMIYMGKNGFRHHTSLTEGHVLTAIEEAFKTYLRYETAIL
jgi:L-fucose isomerase-like protein